MKRSAIGVHSDLICINLRLDRLDEVNHECRQFHDAWVSWVTPVRGENTDIVW